MIMCKSNGTGSERKSRRAPTRRKEHRYCAPSIVVRPLLEMGTGLTETCAHLKTACQKLFPFTRSMFLRPHRQGHRLPAVGAVQQEKLGALCEQCQDELRSCCRAAHGQRASSFASSTRGRSSSAPREARKEHEHHRIEPHRCCSPRAGAH